MLSLRCERIKMYLRRLDSNKEGNNKLISLRKVLKFNHEKMREDCDICAVWLISKHSLSYQISHFAAKSGQHDLPLVMQQSILSDHPTLLNLGEW